MTELTVDAGTSPNATGINSVNRSAVLSAVWQILRASEVVAGCAGGRKPEGCPTTGSTGALIMDKEGMGVGFIVR